MKTKYNFSLSRRYTIGIKLHSWLSWRVTTCSCSFLCSFSLPSVQAGSLCGIIQNVNPFSYVKVLHSLNLRCTFVWNFNVLTFWLRIVHKQFTGNHHLLQQKDSYLQCYWNVLYKYGVLYLTDLIFCVAHVMEILKTVWGNGSRVFL